MKKQFLLILVLLAFAKTITAQQDISLSMYNFNPLFSNPATAGYQDKTWLSAIGRWQWVGIEGAPKSAVVSLQSPLKNDKIALGATIKGDFIGLMKNVGIDASFAYRLPLNADKSTRLSLGIMGSLFSLNDIRTSGITSSQADPTKADVTKFIPNFGFGAYLFNNKKFFVGASVPHILKLRIADPLKDTVGQLFSKVYNHYFATAGYVFGKEAGVKFKPTVFFKVSENSSPNLDVNANILLQERFWLGLGYRFGGDVINEQGQFSQFNTFRGESIIATFKMMATDKLEVGYSYDYPLSNLKQSTSGSHELYIGMDLGKARNMRYVSPRYVHYF